MSPAELDAAAEQVAADAPPLSAEQIDALRALLGLADRAEAA